MTANPKRRKHATRVLVKAICGPRQSGKTSKLIDLFMASGMNGLVIAQTKDCVTELVHHWPQLEGKVTTPSVLNAFTGKRLTDHAGRRIPDLYVDELLHCRLPPHEQGNVRAFTLSTSEPNYGANE